MLLADSILSLILAGFGVLFLISIPFLVLFCVLVLRNQQRMNEEFDISAARENQIFKGIPNPRSHWRAASAPDWRDPEAMDSFSEKLRDLGFQKAGPYTHSDRKTVILLFAVPDHQAAAWLQENEEGEIELTVSSWTTAGAPIRVTTVKNETAVILLPGEMRKVTGSRSPRDLCRELVAFREGQDLQPVTLENVVHLFDVDERARARRFSGDEKAAEVWKRHLKKTDLLDHETGSRIPKSAVENAFLHQLRDTIADCCLDSFARGSDLTAAEWSRMENRFLIVHDRLSTAKLAELDLWESLTDTQRRKMHRVFSKKGVPATKAFHTMNLELPPHLRYTEVGRVSEPVDATVYLAS